MRRFSIASWMCIVVALAGGAQAGEVVPVGAELQVNPYTTGWHFGPQLASLPGGGFLAAWQNVGGPGLLAQRFDADGVEVGDLIPVGIGTRPSVAVQSDGDFVVTWDDDTIDLLARRFDSLGDPMGAPFFMESWATGNSRTPRIEVGPDQRFLVVWHSDRSWADDSSLSVHARLLSPAGQPIGPQFQVNSYTTQRQFYPSAAFDETGGFLVVWSSLHTTGPVGAGFGIKGQRFDSNGLATGGELQISERFFGQLVPDVAASRAGEFVVAWSCDYFEICARRLDSDGASLGSEIQVNAYATGDQMSPKVAASRDGRFTVVWKSEGSFGNDTDEWSIQARGFDATGTPIGAETQVNAATAGTQTSPALATRPDGFVVAWTSYYVPGDSAVRARFLVDLEVFSDGFESGGMSAWLASVP